VCYGTNSRKEHRKRTSSGQEIGIVGRSGAQTSGNVGYPAVVHAPCVPLNDIVVETKRPDVQVFGKLAGSIDVKLVRFFSFDGDRIDGMARRQQDVKSDLVV